ncbi:DUF397 domain-containing protein [Actinomadura soli]|uniref:DUF397 domain-containing protein n=1 Tax=Actinomadura soli TaxID=2508997 RepID=A0A5C4JDD3_9ACTN|nr:DUF397 domain-containing protein [Actinomadura soli]TMR00006.1 DUF397 domain-containing protein [Actinomadura soli]
MDLSAAAWRKASRSNESGDACVEMTSTPDTILIRDSKLPDGPMLVMDRSDFQSFVTTLKNL